MRGISTHFNNISFLKFWGNIRNLAVSIEVLQPYLKFRIFPRNLTTFNCHAFQQPLKISGKTSQFVLTFSIRIRQVNLNLPVVSSKKPIDMTSCGRNLYTFVATCFGRSQSKIEKTALPSQLTQLDHVTRHVPIHLLFF